MVRTIQRLSPGQRTGYVVMNETEAVRKEGMHHPLRIKVGVEIVGVGVTKSVAVLKRRRRCASRACTSHCASKWV